MLVLLCVFFIGVQAGRAIINDPTQVDIALNLRQGEKIAYLKQGYVGLATFSNSSILANHPEVIKFPQYGQNSQPIHFESKISPTLPAVMLPFFKNKFTAVIQFEPFSKTIFISKFPIVNGTYAEPKTLQFEIGVDILGSSPARFFKILYYTQMISLVLNLNDEKVLNKVQELSNTRTLLSFVAINKDKLTLTVVICGLANSDDPLDCLVAFTYNLTGNSFNAGPSPALEVRSLQVTEININVILPRKIIQIPFENPNNPSNFTYSDAIKFIQFFKGQWFGINSLNFLYILGPDEFREDHLSEKRYYSGTNDHLYTNLVATDSYLLGTFKDQYYSQGVSIFYFMDDNFFDNAQPNDKDHRRFLNKAVGGPQIDKETDVKSNELTLNRLDFKCEIDNVNAFLEWNEKIIMFGGNQAFLVGLPPTTKAPPGLNLRYQTVGRLNQTYTFDGENIIYILPLNENTNHCASLTSRALMGKAEPKGLTDINYHLFINDIASGRTVLNFEGIDDSVLQEAGEVGIHLYFKDGSNYLKTDYKVTFKYAKSTFWFWLWIPLGVVALVFLGMLILCLVKVNKAMKRRHSLIRDDSLIPQSIAEKSSPLLDQRVPDRLSGRTAPWTAD